MRKSLQYWIERRQWEGLAEIDALGSILNDPSLQDGGWELGSFLATGTREIASLLALLESINASPPDWDSALDFGCGVGRLTRALAFRFAYVTGVDASATMLCKARSINGDLTNIEFVGNSSSGLENVTNKAYSFVVSSIVLQHIPPPHAERFISDFLRVLKPGGIAAFQIPVEDLRQVSTLRRILWKIRPRALLALVGLGKKFSFSMHAVPEDRIREIIERAGAEVCAVLSTNHTNSDFNGAIEIVEKGGHNGGFASRLFVVRKPLTWA